MIDITSKVGEIKDIEHNKGSYPQNQVILGCIMSSIPLKHKCLSIILILVIVFLFFLLFLIGKNRRDIGKKDSFYQLGITRIFGP